SCHWYLSIACSISTRYDRVFQCVARYAPGMKPVDDILFIAGVRTHFRYKPEYVREGICWFFFSSRRRHTMSKRDWSSDVCSSDLSITVKCGLFLRFLRDLPDVPFFDFCFGFSG